VDLGRFRVGLRVEDVTRAADFYRGLGFTDVGSVPGSDDVPVMVMLQREGVMLIADALVGMPFAPTPRESMIRAGPRGLALPSGLGLTILKPPTDGAARQAARSPPNRGMSRTAIGCSSASTHSDTSGRSRSRSPTCRPMRQ
jgi:hypothetical protein